MKLNPQIVLFDALENVMTGPKYTAAKAKEDFEKAGVTTYDFSKDKMHTFLFE